jgi:hypothetical protein
MKGAVVLLPLVATGGTTAVVSSVGGCPACMSAVGAARKALKGVRVSPCYVAVMLLLAETGRRTSHSLACRRRVSRQRSLLDFC